MLQDYLYLRAQTDKQFYHARCARLREEASSLQESERTFSFFSFLFHPFYSLANIQNFTNMTLTESPPSLQFGSMLIGKKESGARQTTLEQAQEMIDVLKAHQVFQLDSARLYGDGSSEDYLGRLKVQDQGFKVSTKILPLLSTPMSTPLLKNNQYTHSAKDIHDACQASLDSLGMEKVDIYYLHLPDKKTPFAEVSTEYYSRKTSTELHLQRLPTELLLTLLFSLITDVSKDSRCHRPRVQSW